MKKILLAFSFSLIVAQLFAQKEIKHEVSLNLLDVDFVMNSLNRESKAVIGTGIIYAYQFNDLMVLQAGFSSYKTLVEDNCTFCFFQNETNGKGVFTNNEFRLGFAIEKPGRKIPEGKWIVGSTMKLGKANYRAILQQSSFDFFTGEEIIFNIDRDITSTYAAFGLDLGYKYFLNPNIFVVAVSNASTFTIAQRDNITGQPITRNTILGATTRLSNRLSPNVLELRVGFRWL
jgi:hypothetical protein